MFLAFYVLMFLCSCAFKPLKLLGLDLLDKVAFIVLIYENKVSGKYLVNVTWYLPLTFIFAIDNILYFSLSSKYSLLITFQLLAMESKYCKEFIIVLLY